MAARARVAFQGAPGAWSEVALFALHPHDEPEAVPLPHFQDVFAALAAGEVDAAVVPVENSTTGSVFQVVDLLFDSEVAVTGEAIVPIRHALVARRGVRLADVKRVLSHPQALDQCEPFLRRHGLQPVPAFDTAGAAAQLATEGPDCAALASPLAARLHDLDVLARDVAHETNLTRFFLLERAARPVAAADTTTLGFVAAHRPGALLRCLAAFADHGINLLKLESRPVPGQPWHYRFLVDFEGAAADAAVQRALAQLAWHAERVRVFGSYRRATQPA